MTDITSPVWGNIPEPITQGFGPPTADPAMYGYALDYGAPGPWHIGLDIGVPKLTPIYALDYGTVIQSGFSDSFRPNPVWIKTEDDPSTSYNESGYTEIYGHLWQDTVTTGQHVTPGTLLGYSGEQTVKGTMTPDGTGPHLHFELREPDPTTVSGQRAIDPTTWLEKKGVSVQAASGQPTSNTGGSSGTLGDLKQAIVTGSQRLLFLAIGVGLLALGTNALLRTHTGIGVSGRGVKRTIKKAAMVAVA